MLIPGPYHALYKSQALASMAHNEVMTTESCGFESHAGHQQTGIKNIVDQLSISTLPNTSTKCSQTQAFSKDLLGEVSATNVCRCACVLNQGT